MVFDDLSLFVALYCGFRVFAWFRNDFMFFTGFGVFVALYCVFMCFLDFVTISCFSTVLVFLLRYIVCFRLWLDFNRFLDFRLFCFFCCGILRAVCGCLISLSSGCSMILLSFVRYIVFCKFWLGFTILSCQWLWFVCGFCLCLWLRWLWYVYLLYLKFWKL